MQPMALAGLRVLDLSRWWAGPIAARTLGDFGAEVVKVESAVYIDPWRGGTQPILLRRASYADGDPGARPWDRYAYFNQQNRNKLSIALDFAQPLGHEILARLIKISDVVIENFSARVMPNLGFGYESLCRLKPDVILLSMPAFGLTGPERDYVGFGETVEWSSGVTQLNGYEGGPPLTNTGMAYGDPNAGLAGALAVLAALNRRRRTGRGIHIDLSQVEALTLFTAQALMDYSLNRRIPPRVGNRHPAMAPHGVYRCAGDDEWVAISVENDAQWRALCAAMRQPHLAEDQRFATLVGRLRHQNELDELVSAWTSTKGHREAMHILQFAGVAAGAVLNAKELMEDPHLREREFFEAVEHPEVGVRRYPGMPAKLGVTPGSTRIPAPCLGEHSEFVLRELLGMSSEEIEELKEKRIAGNVPEERRVES